MKWKHIYFLKSCTKPEHFPEFNHPEFAFTGRSNVGKSSLINLLMGNKKMVKTGSRPGLTQTINFFIADDNTSIVDLPGFGFAKAPEQVRKKFMPMIKSYITGRNNLKLLFLLIDVRRDPGKYEEDLIHLAISKSIPVAIILTKCDKLSKNQLKKRSLIIAGMLNLDDEALFYTSAHKGTGKNDILRVMQEYREGLPKQQS